MDGQFFPGQAIQFMDGHPRPPWYQRSAQFLVEKMGMATNLEYCIDPGDVASYDPDTDAQAVLDLSGNGNHFQLGATSGSEASDPTFNGTKGALNKTAYFDIDAAPQYLQLAAGSNPAWINAVHKDGGVATFAGWIRYVDGSGSEQSILGTSSSSTAVGFRVRTNGTTNALRLTVGTGSAQIVATNMIDFDTAAGSGNWAFFALSINEAATSLLSRVNGSTRNDGVSYSSPSSSDASGVFTIGAHPNGGSPLLTGSAIGPQWAWSRALSHDELKNLYVASCVRGWSS